MLLLGIRSLEEFIALILVALLGMGVHEFAHGYVAHLWGDPTPRQLGRLTLNPFAHINWMGFAMFVLIGFGVLGSMPINPRMMRNPRWGMLAAVAAGPLSNLALAIISAIALRLLPLDLWDSGIGTLFLISIQWNVLIFLFNILPFSPLDGWTIVLALLPPDLAYWWERNRQNSQFVLFGLILLGFALPGSFNPLSLLLREPAQIIYRVLLG